MTQLPVVPSAPTRAPLQRRMESGVIAGVASGLATHLGLNVRMVRAAFVIASLASGLGLLAYGAMWVLLPSGRLEEAAGLQAASRRGMRPALLPEARPDNGVLVAGGFVVVGLLWLFVSGGVVPTTLFWPMVIGGVGIIVIWLQVDERVVAPKRTDQPLWTRITRGGGTMSIVRLVGGLVLVGAGISWTLATQIGLAQLP
ncbi:PspC domain-containing protein, partial [Tessaracoccus lubricantis]